MGKSTFSGPVASQNGFTSASFTTTQRNALTNVATGTLIYNSTTAEPEVYTGAGWQAAFGPPPASFPLTVTYNTVSTATTWDDESFTLNPTGTQMVLCSGTKIYYFNLSTPWDASTLGVRQSQNLVAYFPGMISGLINGSAFNANGTVLYSIGDAGGTRLSVAIGLSTPYDVTSVNSMTTGMSWLPGTPNSLTFSADGMKAFATSGPYVYMWNLPSAYAWTSISGVSPYTQYTLSATLGLSTNVKQVTFNSTGTIGFTIQSGPSGQGQYTQFQMSTPWDLSTANGGTAVSTSLSFGTPYVGNGGIYMPPANNAHLYFGLYDGAFTPKLFEFNVA